MTKITLKNIKAAPKTPFSKLHNLFYMKILIDQGALCTSRLQIVFVVSLAYTLL